MVDDNRKRWFERQKRRAAFEWKHGQADWRRIAEFILEWEEAHSGKDLVLPRGPKAADYGGMEEKKGIPRGMNKWLEDLAELMGVRVSNLWRYRKAAISAKALWQTKDMMVDTPHDIPAHISPESIELVEKISRAAPSELVDEVRKKLFLNQISRAELRRIWQNIRHVVRVKDKKGVPAYKALQPNNVVRRARLFEELCFEALRHNLRVADTPVLGANGMCFLVNNINAMGVDFVAITQDETGNTLYQAVKATIDISRKDSFASMIDVYNIFDLVWIAIPDGVEDFKCIPEMIGILQYVDGQFVVIRKPIQNPNPDLRFICRELIPQLLLH